MATGQSTGKPVEYDISSRVVTAEGTTSARSEKDRWNDVLNVLDFGAKGDGVDDSAAVAAALTAATGKTLYFPAGTYKVNTLALKTGTRIVGSGWYATILRPKDPDQPVIYIDRDGGTTTGYATEVSDLRIRGFDTGTGHGIHVTDANQGGAGLSFRNVWIADVGGDGFHADALWTSTLENVWVDSVGGDAFYVADAKVGVTFTNTYAKNVPTAGKVGYRIVNGYATLIGANGIDSGQKWGVFGSSIATGDAVDGIAHVTMVGCNVEDFTDTGLTVKNASETFITGTSFVAPAAGTARAVYFQNQSAHQTNLWGPNNRIITKGASWTNGFAIHWNFQAVLRIGKGTDFTSGYYVTGGFGSQMPILMQGDTSDPPIRLRGGAVISDDESTGAKIRKYLSAVPGVSLDFPDTASGASADLTVTVTGAATGDPVTLAIPDAVMTGLGSGAFGFYAWVSATDTVTIRFWNASGGNKNPGGSNAYRVGVWKHYP